MRFQFSIVLKRKYMYVVKTKAGNKEDILHTQVVIFCHCSDKQSVKLA